MSLATDYRPKTFEDVIGQDVIVRTLQNQIDNKAFQNAYIFSGMTGSGKTTTARIFAKAINGGKGTPIELDAASNSGVDNIKAIIKNSRERSFDSEYKVIIIDEAHSLTNQAEEALLKTLEEPPKYTVFILCTTDPQKIKDTIKNRCMRFNFGALTTDEIKHRLEFISKDRGVEVEKESFDYIARISKGSMRNAISLMESAIDYSCGGILKVDDVINALGSVHYEEFIKLIYWLMVKDRKRVLSILDRVFSSGVDPALLIDNFSKFVLEVFKCGLVGIESTSIPRAMEDKVMKINEMDGATSLFNYYIDELLDLKFRIKGDEDSETTVEMNFIKMCNI